MTWNMFYLFDFEELKGGYVAFRGSSPIWLFDIDSLKRTMNYQPVTVGNQSNPSAGFQDEFDAEKAREEEHEVDIKKLESAVNVSPSSSAQSGKQDDKTKKKAKGKTSVESFTGNRDLSAEFEDHSDNSSNDVNAAGYASQLLDNPDMLEMEEITYFDHENVGTEVNFNNLETSITVSPIPTTRLQKDHPVSQIIGDLSSTTQTRKEPKRVHQALKDPSWIEALQEELLQFKMHKFWILVDLPHGKKAIVARIEAIRLFLAYASFMGLLVYQMDVKSAFLYGTIEEELLTKGKSASTPIDTEKPLLKDPDVKRIFRYLKGKPHLGLWYLKDLPFDLVAYSDSDYAGASLEKKSTTGGCQFLRRRLISWQCKKQTVVATSSTEVEYVAATSCCV
nr:putative ribonuclease H-like domain-containing protein [Tanacetum cinerariifolium]